MELLLNRYRNLTVLVIAIAAQLALLAYQVKGNGEVRLIRVWAVSAVTPLARIIEGGRSNISRFFTDYFVLLDVRDENKRMRAELERTKLDNQYLQSELSTADRARSLAIFQQQSPSKTVAAHVIGNSTAVTSKVVIVDRGSNSGIEKGMAVITPDGIVGKVTGAYPTASYVLLITDPTFAAGVISQKNRVHGTLKGQGYSTAMVDYVQNEERLEQGEWFYTSGDDRIFPKGLPVGEATVVRPGKSHKEIYVTPSGLQNGLEEVLIIVEGVHAPIPDTQPSSQNVHLMAPPPGESSSDPAPAVSGTFTTDADRLTDRYRKIGEVEKHVYGGHSPGAPNYNIDLNAVSPKDASAKPADPKSPNPASAVKSPPPAASANATSPQPAGSKLPSPAPAVKSLSTPTAASPNDATGPKPADVKSANPVSAVKSPPSPASPQDAASPKPAGSKSPNPVPAAKSPSTPTAASPNDAAGPKPADLKPSSPVPAVKSPPSAASPQDAASAKPADLKPSSPVPAVKSPPSAATPKDAGNLEPADLKPPNPTAPGTKPLAAPPAANP